MTDPRAALAADAARLSAVAAAIETAPEGELEALAADAVALAGAITRRLPDALRVPSSPLGQAPARREP